MMGLPVLLPDGGFTCILAHGRLGSLPNTANVYGTQE